MRGAGQEPSRVFGVRRSLLSIELPQDIRVVQSRPGLRIGVGIGVGLQLIGQFRDGAGVVLLVLIVESDGS